MKYLLDTAVFLWMIFDEPGKLTKKVLAVLKDDNNKLFFSAASAWEIAIKHSIGKLKLKKNPVDWLPNVIIKMGLHPLPVTQQHAFAIMKLPTYHRDLFDRMLICQAKRDKISIVTPDPVFKKYKVTVIW